jgi:hypothetical protein
MEVSMDVSKKTKLQYDPAVPLLGLYVEEYKSGYNKHT